MIKKFVLVFLCFTLFLSVPGCKKKLPSSPDIPELILPTIAYFTANPTSVMYSASSLLSWSVSNATSISIDHGIGNVEATGTRNVLGIQETKTFTLTATNANGVKTAFCTVEVIKWAELTVSTMPEIPIWIWDPIYNISISDSIIILTETGGVGGVIDGMYIEAWDENLLHSELFLGGTFPALGTFSCYCPLLVYGKPELITLLVEGVDDNSYVIHLTYFWTIAWTQNTGTMRFLKIVEGASHHKLIN